MNTKQSALDAYLARTAAIHTKLERLQQLADDHFGTTPMPSIEATSATSGDGGRIERAAGDLRRRRTLGRPLANTPLMPDRQGALKPSAQPLAPSSGFLMKNTVPSPVVFI